jgi:hypothetical protein
MDAIPGQDQGAEIALTRKVVVRIAVLQSASTQQAAHDLLWLAEFSRGLELVQFRKENIAEPD